VTFDYLGEQLSDQGNFCIDVDAGKYVVDNCTPEFDVSDIVHRLQETDDISRFFQDMRAAFQDHFRVYS
jgi:hypothetical protein